MVQSPFRYEQVVRHGVVPLFHHRQRIRRYVLVADSGEHGGASQGAYIETGEVYGAQVEDIELYSVAAGVVVVPYMADLSHIAFHLCQLLRERPHKHIFVRSSDFRHISYGGGADHHIHTVLLAHTCVVR